MINYYTPTEVPILLVLFNRPDLAKRVLDSIRKVQPSKLFIAIDGPRQNNISDESNVKACIDLIETIDWTCEVKTLIRVKNLGCREAVSSAITWFFSYVDYGIILEDDCLPNHYFFSYCEKLLLKYIDNSSVMYIGGTNFQDGNKRGEASYFFTKVSFMWGWATWKRAWNLYDINMSTYPNFKDGFIIKNIFTEKKYQLYWMNVLNNTYNKAINTWDYQWLYCMWINNGLCILPNINMITNIGYGPEATHTNRYNKYEANRPFELPSSEDINHSVFVIEDVDATEYLMKNLFYGQASIREKCKIFIGRIVTGLLPLKLMKK